MLSAHGCRDDPGVLENHRPGTHHVLLFRIPANGYGGRQFLLPEDDDHVVGGTRNRVIALLVGYVEEYQRIAGDFDLKAAVRAGDGSDLQPGHAELDVFDALALLVDDAPFHGEALLRRQQGGEQDKGDKQPNLPHRYLPPFQSLPGQVDSPGCHRGRIPAPGRSC